MTGPDQIGVRAQPRLNLRGGAKLLLEISREVGQHQLAIVALVPTRGYRGTTKLMRHTVDVQQYPDEEGVWLAVQQFSADRLLALADNEEMDHG